MIRKSVSGPDVRAASRNRGRWVGNALLNVAVVATPGVAALAAVRRALGPPIATTVLPRDAAADVGDRPRIGPDDAVVTIVVFSDFACRYCRAAAADLAKFRRRWPGRVAVVMRHFPILDHGWPAALTAVCAARQGRLEAVQGVLCRDADAFGAKPWTAYAWEAGVRDTSAFSHCLTDAATVEIVRLDVQAAEDLGIRATPGVLVGRTLFLGRPGERRLRSSVLSSIEGKG